MLIKELQNMTYWSINTEINLPPIKKRPSRKPYWHTQETRARSLANLKNPKGGARRARKAIVISEDGSFKEFGTLIEVARHLGVNKRAAHKCAKANKTFLRGHNDHRTGGCRVYYEDDLRWLKKTKYHNF